MQLYEPGVNASEATSVCIALGRFREPPVFARFGRTNGSDEIRGVAGHMPKRLPSRRWAIAHSRERATPFEDSLPDVASRPVRRSFLEYRSLKFQTTERSREDDDEHEDETNETNIQV
jgi:hypothetical protein